MDPEKREFVKWAGVVLATVAFGLVVLWVLSAVGIMGDTLVSRKVFEQSYQRKAGVEAAINTFEAQLEELRSQLADERLDDHQRSHIEAQIRVITIKLNAAKAIKREE